MPKINTPLITGNASDAPTRAADIEQSLADTQLADDSRLKAATKRLSLNGSSYSGTDIKVLVHKYHPGPTNLVGALDRATGIYGEVSGRLAELATNVFQIETARTSFQAGDIDESTYQQRLQDIYLKPVREIAALEGEAQTDGYLLFIANSLRGQYILAQQNAHHVSRNITSLKEQVDSTVLGWKAQRDALLKGQKDGRFFQTKVLAELQTLSVSTFREKGAVRAFGHSNPKGYTRGQRTTAGSMIFTVFDKNVLFELLDFDPSDFDGDNKFKAAILDQLPPMDVTIIFANEYGSLSRMTIYGIEFVSEGQTMSIEDILLENVVQYVARDVDPMTPLYDESGRSYSEVLTSYNQALAQARRPERPLRASDLLGSDYGNTEGQDAAEQRFKNRFNPFY